MFDEEFWSNFEKEAKERIREIDQRVGELYRERDKLTDFLKDHGRARLL